MALTPAPDDLRKKAAQARHVARIKTEGGQAADRQLMAFANQLDREADELEGKPTRKKPPMATE